MASDSSNGKPPTPQTVPRRQRVLESRPIEAKPSDEASTGSDFQKNFPEASTEPASVTDALKNIKPEDVLQVHKTVCGRQGFMTAIGAGTFAGGVRFVWRGVPRSAANWGVGGAIIGALVSFEYCQYLRRLERMSMKRIVEVHTASLKEKKEKIEREEQERKKLEEMERKKSWWKPW